METLFDGIAVQAGMLASRWEVIFVDDGSSDESWSTIAKITKEYPRNAKAIRFCRNLGKVVALAAGWKEATGDFFITMDADLQECSIRPD